jgi:hypothetical protein
MIEFGVGVGDVETIKLKRLDEDYFGEGFRVISCRRMGPTGAGGRQPWLV